MGVPTHGSAATTPASRASMLEERGEAASPWPLPGMTRADPGSRSRISRRVGLLPWEIPLMLRTCEAPGHFLNIVWQGTSSSHQQKRHALATSQPRPTPKSSPYFST